MNNHLITLPPAYEQIKKETEAIGFSMASDVQTGSLLSTLVASKSNGRILELGTGTGLSLAWIVAGMDANSIVTTIDNNPIYTGIAKKYFGDHPGVAIIEADAATWLTGYSGQSFDLIFADAWPGKYEYLNETLQLLKPGSFYVIDDMLPQPNWPEGHSDHVARLIHYLDTRTDLHLTKMSWSTGLLIATKKS